MFASIVSRDRCQLFNVVRTDLRTGEITILTYPPSDMPTAVKRAAWYQRVFDPSYSHYDYRCGMCS